MKSYTFNVTPVELGPSVTDVFGFRDLMCIPATPNLERASLENALLFGGPAVRRCLEQAPIVGDHKHVHVDTKVSMLLPGFIPAIPGWHTDGVPRRVGDTDHEASLMSASASNTGAPSLSIQADLESRGYAPRFHTIHVGNDCPTRFMRCPFIIGLEHGEDSGLYREMSEAVNAAEHLDDHDFLDAAPGQWLSWDWWNIHTATAAKTRGWRLLIRVTESDQPPRESDFIRSQTQVYVPTEFGW
ncbi:Uncharacterised protein [Mycobacteroides abscessus subsp. massiliense]|uniref:hypothetical protein n=1 Tax=Mycobacteroides abscessus TaxID=36809 RepID=UPI0009A875F0|nr:hypothetical protein [Mycobacteroides abscessus]SKM81593.1 Uncharacterised protein [Mycobacteroides abscessus subsp. massiliense]SKM98226.1 Uncharacterised protein [Mycobacteroides abscessus subsp. massiliense]SKN76914.1 Uncharacterised protein [Mycobacteroides abscessus subsp. massiliense]SKN96183.1 Uncharacterised protein [Mycobacteroides abscessus subsp. massiliense]SKO21714.1 Uncharacterised protein [Mycobacteroides abscessus subsp. massiliense]